MRPYVHVRGRAPVRRLRRADVPVLRELARAAAALQRLPGEQREAFVLQAEGGLSVQEIAVICGTTFETAKSRLRYAREKLRVLLQEYAS